jgi:hypothetical protein
MGKVYVVQEPRHRGADGQVRKVNMLPAMEFGVMELLLPPEEQFSVLNVVQLTQRLKRKLSSYSDADYILAAGDPAAIGAACAAAAWVNNGRFTILKWDNQERKYYPVPIDLKKEET